MPLIRCGVSTRCLKYLSMGVSMCAFLRSMLVVASIFFFAGILQAGQSRQLPYYGSEFYKNISYGMNNENLKQDLRFILESFHKVNNGNYDEVGKSCDGQCYQHVSIGYDQARVFMMGVYYLVDNGHGNYAIPDMYCDTLRDAHEFVNGSAPAPNQIPDGNIVNTEHTWPQSKFTGRYDRRMQKSDLHHLFPTDNEMNSIRGNNPFGIVARPTKTLKCPVSKFGRATNSGADVFEPPKGHKGNVARALFYFSVRYDIPIDEKQEVILRQWHAEDPVNDEEIRRNDAIQKIQGNRNPFIDHPELVGMINNF